MTRSNRNVYLLIGSIRDCIVCLLLIRNDYGISSILIIGVAEAVLFIGDLSSHHIQTEVDGSGLLGGNSVGLVAHRFGHINLHNQIVADLSGSEKQIVVKNGSILEICGGCVAEAIIPFGKRHTDANISDQTCFLRESLYLQIVGQLVFLIKLVDTRRFINNIHVDAVLQRQIAVVFELECHDLSVTRLPQSLLENVGCSVEIVPVISIESVLHLNVQIPRLDLIDPGGCGVGKPRESGSDKHRNAYKDRKCA